MNGPERSSNSPIPLLRNYLHRLVQRSHSEQLLPDRSDSEHVEKNKSRPKTEIFSSEQVGKNNQPSSSRTEVSESSYPKKKWQIDIKQLKFHEIIGTGGSSHVYKGTYKGKRVAIKKFVQIKQNHLTQELAILNKLRSPEIVEFIGAYIPPPQISDQPAIVMEYCSRGSVYQVMKESEFNWDRLFQISCDAICGISYLHAFRPPIIHRDLKSMNLLIDKNWKTKIADFGLSMLELSNVGETQKLVGTYPYLAPELVSNAPYSTRSDMYSFSIILWEMLYRCIKGRYQAPYAEYPDILDIQILPQAKEKNLRPSIPHSCLPEFRELLVQCWSVDPYQRPSAPELTAHLKRLQDGYHQNPNVWVLSCRFTTDSDVQSVDSRDYPSISFSDPDSYDPQHPLPSSSPSPPIRSFLYEEPQPLSPQRTIHDICKNGSLAELKKLIQLDPDQIHDRDSKQQTALHIAVGEGRTKVVEYLLSHPQIDINAVDTHGFTPLHCSCNYGQLEICELLLDRQCNITLTKDGTSGLHYLVRKTGFQESKDWYKLVLTKLVARGADVNGANRIGETPLHQACKHSNFEAVEFLLSNKANINARTGIGETPLHYAVMRKDYQIVQAIVQAADQVPDLTIVSQNQRTVLDLASGDILKILKKVQKRNKNK